MLNGLEPFLGRLFGLLESARLDVSGYEMDHVCYRVETMARYESLAHAWRLYADDVHESLVNGRPITVFALRHPQRVLGREVTMLELPAPKPGHAVREGWEHAEFVIDEPFEALMSRYAHLAFDLKGVGKEINPELGLKLGDGLQAKFHHKPLRRVIEIERGRGLALPRRDAP